MILGGLLFIFIVEIMLFAYAVSSSAEYVAKALSDVEFTEEDLEKEKQL